MAGEKIVNVNVGGVRYTTCRQTLTHYPQSRLGLMFNRQKHIDKDRDGNYFIDRDGQLFRYILNFLRGDCYDWFFQFHVPDGFNELDALLEEARYYEIEPLVDILCGMQADRTNGSKPKRREDWAPSNDNSLHVVPFLLGFGVIVVIGVMIVSLMIQKWIG